MREWARLPITRIVAYAVEAPKAPKIAARTARVRWVGEMGAGDAAGAGLVMRVVSMLATTWFGSGSPVMGSTGGLGKSHVGRATSRTPEKAIRAARLSRIVKGSRSQMKQTSAVRVGIIKVITVASEMFNHESESDSHVSLRVFL